eukprot:467887_1
MQSIVNEYTSNIRNADLYACDYNNHILAIIFYSEKIDRLTFRGDFELDEFDTDYISIILIVSMLKPVENAAKIWNYINETEEYSSEWIHDYSDTESFDSDEIPMDLVDYINGCRLDGQAWKSKYGEKLLNELINRLAGNFGSTWVIETDYSLIKNVTMNPKESQIVQQQYAEFELRKFNEWKHNVWKLFAVHMSFNVFELLMIYCERTVAHYYCINKIKKSVPKYDGGDMIGDVLGCKLPSFLQDKVQFGDVIEVPGWRSCAIYIVENVGRRLLSPIGWEGNGALYIPVSITNELADPVEFYRFCSPTQGLAYQHAMEFDFSHRYIQNILGIHSLANTNNHNYELYKQWEFRLELQQYFQINPEQYSERPFDNPDFTIRFNINSSISAYEINEISVPINYAKHKSKPLIYYIEQLYEKHVACDKLNKYIATKENQNTIKQNIVMINALMADKWTNNELMFDRKLQIPITWCLDYSLATDSKKFKFQGLLYEKDEMINFIKNTDYIYPGYTIEIKYNISFQDKPLFWQLNDLILPPGYPSSHCYANSNGLYTIVPSEYIHIAVGILNGMKLYGYSQLKWKVFSPVISLKEYQEVAKRKYDNNLHPHLIYDDNQCIKLVKCLLHVYSKKKKCNTFTLADYEMLMITVREILICLFI